MLVLLGESCRGVDDVVLWLLPVAVMCSELLWAAWRMCEGKVVCGGLGLFLLVAFDVRVFGFGLPFCQDDDVVGIFCHPFLTVSQFVLVLPDGVTGFAHVVFLPVFAVHDVADGFLRHGPQRVLEEARDTEFPFHKVAHEHHEVLAEALEYDEVAAYFVDVTAVALDAFVDFFEKVVRDAVDFGKHLFAAVFFAQSQLVVERRYMEGLFEYAQVRQCREVGYAQLRGHDRLVVYAYECHEVLHASHAPAFFTVGSFLFEQVGEYSHVEMFWYSVCKDKKYFANKVVIDSDF